ncbi:MULTISPECIES: mannose-6-phosphate isomerase, class I [Actinotignum]|uniref:mannose-6-phosphate isomerase n=13 Tax=Actinomycetaceae TaxID=2049 RepID=A0AAW9HNX4_9ACTO|nr:mannose-6-phosphate isomerase, class I [Actinotignum timonense]MDK6374097.1 mannose-6-phosphate isomerase, class I [Actinotignum timonense]MDK6419730.1 mannose-6-phosphate isomerase, class I [Actinotignum timonense]MDK6644715.1 mannose-6-phosphate isomerase, class I [Actinotignum timonense]MDK6781060.1 mannose-6-phosphate isomerase, class I [Actinotignum timonense]MDK8358438.1 mannose-6-phosphate isomerase, class I [Actinotignum timonense]
MRIQGRARDYAWGGTSALPALFGYAPAETRVAEIWLGAHPDDSAQVIAAQDAPLFDLAQLYPSAPTGEHRIGRETEANEPGRAALRGVRGRRRSRRRAGPARGPRTPELPEESATLVAPGGPSLRDLIARAPEEMLGADVARRHGGELPYLLKLIAPHQPLSLQVHPSLEQARAGFEREEAAGISRTAPHRSYRDRNHKPELAYALTPFEAICGLRTPRRIAEVLGGLGLPLTNRLAALVEERGVGAVFADLLSAGTRPEPEQIEQVVAACAARLERGASPSPRADRIVETLAQHYPGDPGVVASLLMNPVTLRPGEALFIPAGTVHAYLSGTAVEIMAASDNVLRAGLTPKHVDVAELLRIMDDAAVPPIRIAPEHMSEAVSTFYVPVDDFELSVVHLRDATTVEKLRSRGPRTVVCLEGAVEVFAGGRREPLNSGQAVFVPHCDGELAVRGFGDVIVASVP